MIQSCVNVDVTIGIMSTFRSELFATLSNYLSFNFPIVLALSKNNKLIDITSWNTFEVYRDTVLKSYPNFTYIHNSCNKSIQENTQILLENCRTKYMIIVDDDIICYDHRLFDYISYIQETNYYCVAFDTFHPILYSSERWNPCEELMVTDFVGERKPGFFNTEKTLPIINDYVSICNYTGGRNEDFILYLLMWLEYGYDCLANVDDWIFFHIGETTSYYGECKADDYNTPEQLQELRNGLLSNKKLIEKINVDELLHFYTKGTWVDYLKAKQGIL